MGDKWHSLEQIVSNNYIPKRSGIFKFVFEPVVIYQKYLDIPYLF